MPRRFTHCPKCRQKLIRSTTIAEALSEFWLECANPNCNTFINTYIPQQHQRAVHLDSHTYIGNFGAYGTGKTLTSRQELYKHMFITPNANMLVGANVSAQYEQTLKRDIEMDLPKQFIPNVSVQKAFFDTYNGGRIMFRSFDDPDKLRSLNLTFFVMVEASEIKAEAFHQLKTRLRNLYATAPLRDPITNEIVMREIPNSGGQEIPVIAHDWRKGIIESNPDSGWIRNEVLLNSSAIQQHGNTADTYHILPDSADPAISTHVASTDVNGFLPPTFISELVKNKPMWWVDRFVRSSFSYAEGLVYPSAPKTIIPAFEIPKSWKRIIAADYGLADDFVFLFGAVDEKQGILHIYKEVRTNNKNIEELAKLYFQHTADIPAGGLAYTPILDPKSGAKRDYDKKTLFTHFLDEGILFAPGHVSIDARVMRTNTYIESDKLRIHDSCTGLIHELENYKFPAKELGKTPRNADKPIDKNNHAINPLEWICMELPSNPANLLYGVYNRDGVDVSRVQPQDGILPNALTDNDYYDSYEREVYL